MQKSIMPKVKLLTALLALSCILISLIGNSSAQVSPDIVMVHSEVDWTDDMRRLSPPTTTPNVGFSVKVTITNNGNLPLKVGCPTDYSYPAKAVYVNSLTINIELTGVDTTRAYNEERKIVFNSDNSLELQPQESFITSVITFDDRSNYENDFELRIGSYKAEITYQINGYGEEHPVEKYPFNFEVVSESQLQELINANKDNGSWLNIDNVTIFDFSSSTSITIFAFGGVSIALALLLVKRRHRNR